MDRNECVLVGKMGAYYKEGVAQNGSRYLWFTIELETKGDAISSAYTRQSINILCFRQKVVEYLKRVKLTQGNTIIVFGFINSFQNVIKGKYLATNSVNANEIYVVKTKA